MLVSCHANSEDLCNAMHIFWLEYSGRITHSLSFDILHSTADSLHAIHLVNGTKILSGVFNTARGVWMVQYGM